jgi:hypothetical protein
MVDEGTVARSPEELDAWIARTPDAREPLVRGGYGTHFDAADLLPLLEHAVARVGGVAPARAAVPARGGWNPWVVGLFMLIAVAVLVMVGVTMTRT